MPRGFELYRFELYRTWQMWLNEVPALREPIYGLIAWAMILTESRLEEVEFVSGASKSDIFKVYQWLEEKNLLDSLVSSEKVTKRMEEGKEGG